jgi:multidrug efflux pump subunit AcrA (membrane-fusion protein)
MDDSVKSPLMQRSAMDRPRMLPWWRRGRWISLGALTAALLLVLVVGLLLLGPAQRSIRIPLSAVIIGKVERGVYHDIIPLTGEVVPHDTVDVDSSEGGRIERILAQAGDHVTAGQPLVELSNTALELDVLDREGRLVQSITESQSYATQLEQNRVTNRKALSQIDYDIVRLRRALERRETLVFEGPTPPGLLRGQTLQGRLSLGVDQIGLVLPTGAFLERSGGDWAFVLATDGRSAHRRHIKIGRRNPEQLEVLAGLEPGERVITSDYESLERIERIDLQR